MGFDDFYVRKVGFERGEMSVALVGFVDVADEPFVDVGREGAVNLCSADDENFLVAAGDILGAVDDIDALMAPLVIPSEDDIAAFGQRSANRFEGFSAHQDRVAEGGFFEEREILWQVPRQGSVASDQTVRIHSDDGGEHDFD